MHSTIISNPLFETSQPEAHVSLFIVFDVSHYHHLHVLLRGTVIHASFSPLDNNGVNWTIDFEEVRTNRETDETLKKVSPITDLTIISKLRCFTPHTWCVHRFSSCLTFHTTAISRSCCTKQYFM